MTYCITTMTNHTTSNLFLVFLLPSDGLTDFVTWDSSPCFSLCQLIANHFLYYTSSPYLFLFSYISWGLPGFDLVSLGWLSWSANFSPLLLLLCCFSSCLYTYCWSSMRVGCVWLCCVHTCCALSHLSFSSTLTPALPLEPLLSLDSPQDFT